MTRGPAIKAKCLDCAGGKSLERTLCQVLDCPLWEFRMGQEPHNPKHLEKVAKALAYHARDTTKEYRDFYAKLGV